jgi:hypothetical protein
MGPRDELAPRAKFQDNFSDFIDLIISIVESTPDEHKKHFVDAAKVRSLKDLIRMYDVEVIMTLFIKQTESNWVMIKERNIQIFAQLQDMLGKLPIKDIKDDTFVNIMTLDIDGKPVVPANSRQLMWEYMESFVYILIEYVHTTRLPKTKLTPDGKKRAVYTRSFMPSFNVLDHSKTWSVDLHF